MKMSLKDVRPYIGAARYVIGVAGPVAWTAVGLAIGSGLRRAGVGRGLSTTK